MSERPQYNPAELEAAGLTEEEAEGIRLGLEQIDRGETVSLDDVCKEALAKIEEVTRTRRTG